MKDYDDELLEYEMEAEDRYDDYDYDENDDFDTGFEGNEDAYDEDYDEGVEYVEDYEDDYDSYKATSIGKIDPNDRTLTVVVKNTSGNDGEVVLFGANEGIQPAAGFSIVVEESSHNEVREESKANPFVIDGMKMSVSDPLQFDNVLRIVKRTATGSHTSQVFQPRNATSPQNFTSNLIDSDFSMEVTGQSSLRFTIKDGATVVFTFTIKARANMSNLLKGRNVAEMSTTPRTTGLPQLDLLRKRRPTVFGIKPMRRPRRFKRRPRRTTRPMAWSMRRRRR